MHDFLGSVGRIRLRGLGRYETVDALPLLEDRSEAPTLGRLPLQDRNPYLDLIRLEPIPRYVLSCQTSLTSDRNKCSEAGGVLAGSGRCLRKAKASQ